MKINENTLIILLLSFGTLVQAQKTDVHGQKTNSSKVNNSKSIQKGQTFGEKITSSNPRESLSSIQKKVVEEKSSKKVTLEGEVTQVCENKGCWIVINTPQNEKFLVQMKDYGFFVPKDIRGKKVLLEGIAEQRKRMKDAQTSDSTQIRIVASGIEVVD